MHGLRRMRIGRSLRRRAGAALALIAYLAATLGYALPHPVQKSGQPFPCQHHLCGCQTAEQCWRHCCCFSPEEHRTWARAHSVPVPDYAEQPKNKSWCSVRLRDRADGKSKTHTCCARTHQETSRSKQSKVPACCAGKKIQANTSTEKRTCCSTKAKADRAPATPTGRWRLALGAFRCQGLATVWISGGAVLPVPEGPDWSPNRTPVCQIAHSPSRAPRRPVEPLAPPPRFATA
jgi:hypothetical protein